MSLPVVTPRTTLPKLAEYINDYVPFLAGTSGGTTIYGSPDSGEDLNLSSNANGDGSVTIGRNPFVEFDEDTTDITINITNDLTGISLISNSASNQPRISFDNGTQESRIQFSSVGFIFRDETNEATPFAIFHDAPHQAFRVETDELSINENGGDYDFRVESDNLTHALFVDASADSVGINASSINAVALLQLDSTSKGFLPPRMTTAQRSAISSPPKGLTIFNTITNKLEVYDGSSWQACW